MPQSIPTSVKLKDDSASLVVVIVGCIAFVLFATAIIVLLLIIRYMKQLLSRPLPDPEKEFQETAARLKKRKERREARKQWEREQEELAELNKPSDFDHLTEIDDDSLGVGYRYASLILTGRHLFLNYDDLMDCPTFLSDSRTPDQELRQSSSSPIPELTLQQITNELS